MKKTLIALTAAVLAATALGTNALADDQINVRVNGQAVEFDVPPMLMNDRTMVPIRFITEKLGAAVSWSEETQTATVVKGDTTIDVTLGADTMVVNGKATFLDSPAVSVNDRTLVPVRAISESFGLVVGWDEATSTVTLDEPKAQNASVNAAMFTAGNGYHIYMKNEAGQSEVKIKNTPVTVSDSADGVSVSHGGYYWDGENWGGIASNEKFALDGLKLTVRFDQVPEATDKDDCWISVDFLSKPEMFKVGNIVGNPGLMSLIRFGSGNLEIYDGVEGFSRMDNIVDDFFFVKTGDVLTLEVSKNDNGMYQATYTKGEQTVTAVYNSVQLAELFPDGKAHIVISASKLGSMKDAFKYTVTELSYLG